MLWLISRLRIPANESQMALVLALCSLAMTLMLWVILWQSDVIAEQGAVIRWLRDLRLGS